MRNELRTSQDAFDDLWEAVHKARSNTKHVRVSKDQLTDLLMDHSTLVRLTEDRQITLRKAS